jgi:hypothetical protein
MPMPEVSLVATLVAAILGFALGAAWYGPLFGKAWVAAVGLDPLAVRKSFNPAKTYGATFLLGLVAAYALGLFLGPNPGRAFAAAAGAGAGLCLVATSLATNVLFEGRSWTLILINGGYHAVRFTLIGVVFGLLG